MKFTLDWLKDYLNTDKTPQTLADCLSKIGLEVEELQDSASALKPFITAKILEAKPHPNADKLQVLSVSIGTGNPLQIVCGAPNARAGLIGILARSGDVIPAFGEALKDTKIRGIESQGMMCSMRELGLGKDHDGIIDLLADTPIGISATQVLSAPVLFDAEVTSNRSDYLGVKGIARDLAAADQGAFIKETILPLNGMVQNPISTTLEKEIACSSFSAVYIKDVKNINSPKWMQDRLNVVGIAPKSFVVDLTNYMMMDWGRPTHVFDADKIVGKLTIRLAKKGETLTSVADGKTIVLNGGETVVSDDTQIVLLSGIMGAKESAWSMDTKNILLIAEALDAVSILKTSRQLKIESDSKYRFERGVDSHSCEPALCKMTHLILQHCGGQSSDIMTEGEKLSSSEKIEYDLNLFKKKIGTEISRATAKTILQKLGCVVEENGDVFSIVPPTYRADLKETHDITEELVRIFGYDKIQPIPLSVEKKSKAVLTPAQIRIFRTKRFMASMGYNETLSWSFVSSRIENEIGSSAALKIQNPITADHDVLRTTMLSSLLPAVAGNHARDQLDLALFEIAPLFYGKMPGEQEDVLGAVLTGRTGEKSWDGLSHEVSVYDAKSALMSVLNQWDLDKSVKIEPLECARGFHPHRLGIVKLGKVEVARFGEIHPSLLDTLKIKTRVYFFELFLDRLPVRENKTKKPVVLSNLQMVRRDFSFVVDEIMPADILLNAVKKALPPMADLTLFDVYQGKGIESGKKALALTVILTPADSTYTEGELEKISTDIIQTVEKIGGKLR